MGVYIGQNNATELLFLIGAGIIATILRVAGYPLASLLIGLIFGPMLEDNFARASQLAGGFDFIFERPMALGLLIFALLLIFMPTLKSVLSKK